MVIVFARDIEGMTILTEGMQEPLEWDTAADADAGLLVAALDLGTADRLEEKEVGLVIDKDQDVVVGLAQLGGHRVLGRGPRGGLLLLLQEARQRAVQAGIFELLHEVLEHLPILVGQLGYVVVRQQVGDLVGLGGEVLDVARDLGQPELQGGLPTGVAGDDEAGQGGDDDGRPPPLVLDDPRQQLDLLRGVPVRIPWVRFQVGQRHNLGVGTANFHGTLKFGLRRTKGGLKGPLLFGRCKRFPVSMLNACFCVLIGLPARWIGVRGLGGDSRSIGAGTTRPAAPSAV